MRVLAIDTSTRTGSVALLDLTDGVTSVVGERLGRAKNRHGQTLLPMIRGLLEDAAQAREELGLIAVGLGPGSFTGTRVGVSVAKGLALGLELPIVGVSSLRALARGAGGGRVGSVVDAMRGMRYAAIHDVGRSGATEVLAPFEAAPERVAARFAEHALDAVVGDAAEEIAPELARGVLFEVPRASCVGLEALAVFRAEGPDSLDALEPRYVRPSDAKLPERPLA